jgi:drug/metabolite transporter (DMT)-like permease
MAAGGLLILCFLWALGSLRSDLLPSFDSLAIPLLQQQAMQFAALAAVSALIAVVRNAPWPKRRQLRSTVLIGLAFFVAPTLLGHFARDGVSSLMRVALYSLAPVFAVVLEPYIGRCPAVKGGLIAAMLAFTGTLCIFPVEAPRSFANAIDVGAMVLAVAIVAAANCGAVVLARELPSTASFAATTGAVAAAGLGLASAFTERAVWSWNIARPHLIWSAAVELPSMLLLFWLMKRMSAARMSIRFVVAPLIANVVGMILLRPPFDLRTGLGLLLIACGSGWLLFAREEEADKRSGSLHLNLD